MIIGNKNYEEVIFTNDEDEVLAIVSDDEVIEKKGNKVKLIPASLEE